MAGADRIHAHDDHLQEQQYRAEDIDDPGGECIHSYSLFNIPHTKWNSRRCVGPFIYRPWTIGTIISVHDVLPVGFGHYHGCSLETYPRKQQRSAHVFARVLDIPRGNDPLPHGLPGVDTNFFFPRME